MRTKKLADFKRDIVVGMKILCNGMECAKQNDGKCGPLFIVPVPEKMEGARIVTRKDTTGFYLSGSFCGYPKSENLFYDGGVFQITEKTKDGQVWQRRHYIIIK